LKKKLWQIVAVVVETEGWVLEEEDGITGIGSSRTSNFSRILNNSNKSFRISSRIRVAFLSLHNPMILFLLGCLLLGFSRVPILNSLPSNLVSSPTNGLHLLQKTFLRIIKVQMVMVLVEQKVCKISGCRRRKVLPVGSLLS
jgi:hypothetical protein